MLLYRLFEEIHSLVSKLATVLTGQRAIYCPIDRIKVYIKLRFEFGGQYKLLMRSIPNINNMEA